MCIFHRKSAVLERLPTFFFLMFLNRGPPFQLIFQQTSATSLLLLYSPFLLSDGEQCREASIKA